MKYIYKILALLVIAAGMTSCDPNENFEILPKEESLQILTPGSGEVIVLDDTNLSNNALFLSWSSPDSNFDYTYDIEVAQTGTDFENPTLLGQTETTNFSMSVDELNSFLLDVMNLDPEDAASLDVKVLTGNETSQIISLIFTPYTLEYTEFYLVGSLTNWNPEESLPMTKTDFNKFEITVDLADGDEFKFLPTNTGWDGDFGEDPDNLGTLIQEGEQNLKGYAAGKYKVSVDLNTFTFVVEEVIAPENLFLVGSLTGWDPATSLPFFNSGENVFTIVAELPEGAEFKFLPTNTGWDGDWGEDPNNPGAIIQDGEQNVTGYAAGNYLITVDFNMLTYKLDNIDNLYLVGSLTGWDPGTSLQMGEASLGIFSTIVDLPDGAEFKFLPTNTGWDGDWGEDANNPSRIVQEGEENLKGFEAGTYVVAVDFNTLSFTVSKINEKPTSLFLVGGFRGWTNDGDNPQFTETASGIFEITQILSANDEFKFVRTAGSWDNDLGESKVFQGVLEENDENNLKVKEAGTYKIIVNFNAGTISVN
jgi:hypothetical protein